MKKIAFISDLLFTFFLTFIVSVVLFRRLRVSLLPSVLLAIVCGILTALSYGAFRYSKRKHEFLKMSEERKKEKLLLHLALSDGDHIVEFFNSHHPDPNDPNAQADNLMNDGMFRFKKVMR